MNDGCFRLNEGAADAFDDYRAELASARTVEHRLAGSLVIDCGVEARGGLVVGQALAEICLAGLGDVELGLDKLDGRSLPTVTVRMDEPVAACLFSQYAGWPITHQKYFAMGSGPMRAVRGKEAVFEKLAYREPIGLSVGILETAKLPTEETIEYITNELTVEPSELILLVARTASLAGMIQVVARSVETALHKLFSLGFDVTRIKSAMGRALLPPVPANDLSAIGRSNDSILYGAEVCFWIEGDDASIAEVGPKVPSSSSKDYGLPFADIFERFGRDFYKIDPHLFSPAMISFNNLETGSHHQFGKLDEKLLVRSFFG